MADKPVTMVAVDGSKHSEASFAHATRNTPEGHRLHIVMSIPDTGAMAASNFAIDTTLETGDLRRKSMDKTNAYVEKTASKFRALCKDAARECTFNVVKYDGGVSELGASLCREASRVDAETLVVGSHGRSAAAKMILGSVSSYCVQACPCSVTVVKK